MSKPRVPAAKPKLPARAEAGARPPETRPPETRRPEARAPEVRPADVRPVEPRRETPPAAARATEAKPPSAPDPSKRAALLEVRQELETLLAELRAGAPPRPTA